MNNPKNIATDYALNKHWAVFPVHGIVDGACACGNPECKSPGKHPTTGNGLKAATRNASGFGMLFKDGNNIAVATGEPSGFWVLDIDGQAGEAALAKLERDNEPLPSTLTHYTGNGRHLMFNWPGLPVKNSVKRLGENLDVRGDGGYIVVAPSTHVTGAQYRFANPDTPIADAPQWLLDMVLREDHTRIATHIHPQPERELSAGEVADMLSFISPDCDYQTWVEIGMGLHAGGYPVQVWDDWSRNGAKYENGDCYKRWKGFKPGAVTMGSVWHHAEQAGWSPSMLRPPEVTGPHPAQGLIDSLSADVKALPNKKEFVGQKFPIDPLALSGVIGDTVRWICGSAIKPQPELALLNTLAALGAVFGRRYATEWDTRTNLYIVGLSATGSGKEHSRKQVKKLMVAAGLQDYLAGDGIRSGAGMLRGIEKHPAQILHLDEIGMLLKGITDERAPAHAREISKNLTELFTSSSSVFHGGNYASADVKPIIIDHPNLCIYGTSTRDKYTEALSRSAIASGELNRFLIFEGRKVVRQDDPRMHDPDVKLVGEWSTFADHYAEGQGNLQGVGSSAVAAPKPIVVRWETVMERLRLLGHREDELAEAHEPVDAAGVWTRYREQIIKIAMVFAIARNPIVPIIEHDDLDIAEALVDWSCRYVTKMALEHVADSQVERETNKVLQLLREANGEWITRTELTRRLNMKKRDRDELLTDLVEVQQVVEVSAEQGERGPKTIKYRYCG